jgi:hypothetical protein
MGDVRIDRVDGDNAAMNHSATSHNAVPAHVWIFHSETGRFASGVFTDQASGLVWVAQHELTGVLAEYEVGNGCYDFAVEEGRFRNTKPHHGTPEHVGTFSPGLGHIHVQGGQRAP